MLPILLIIMAWLLIDLVFVVALMRSAQRRHQSPPGAVNVQEAKATEAYHAPLTSINSHLLS